MQTSYKINTADA